MSVLPAPAACVVDRHPSDSVHRRSSLPAWVTVALLAAMPLPARHALADAAGIRATTMGTAASTRPIYLPFAATVSSAPRPTLLAQFGGSDIRAVAVVGERVYVGTGPRLDVLDAADPANPRVVDSHVLPGLIQDIQVDDDAVAVAVERGGLVVMTADDPDHPAVAATLRVSDTAVAVTVVNRVAYVATGSAGLRIADLASPPRARWLGAFETAGDARGVAVDGSVAYVVEGAAGAEVLDVTDPTRPRRIGSVAPAKAGRSIDAVATQPGLLFALESGTGLRVLDVSDPSTPEQIGHLRLPAPGRALRVRDSRVYIADSSGGLRMADVADPRIPREWGVLGGVGSAVGLAVSRARVYVAGGSTLAIVAVGSEPVVREARRFDPRNRIEALRIVREGVAVAAAGAGGVRMIDLADPTRPREAALLPLASPVHLVAAADDVAVVGSELSGFDVLDVSSATAPRVIAHWDGAMAPTALAIRGARAYVGDGPSLVLVDLGDRHKPATLGRLNLPSPTSALAVGDGVVYAIGRGGAWSVDVTEPSAPRLAGSFELDSPVGGRDIAVVGSRVFAVTWDRLLLFDVADPARPRLLATRYADRPTTVAATTRMAVLGTYGGVVVFDVTDRAAPREVAALSFFDHVLDVAIDGSLAVAAARDGTQLTVIDMHPSAATPIGNLPAYGDATGFARSGTTALVGADASVRLVDWSGAGEPVEHPATSIGAPLADIATVGDQAFLVEARWPTIYLEALDLDDPTRLRVTSSVTVATKVAGGPSVAAGDALAVVGAGDAGLHVFDVGTAPPRAVGALTTTGTLGALHLDGQTLYAIDQQGRQGSEAQTESHLLVVDLHDPTRPLPLADPIVAGGPVQALTVADGTAFLAMGDAGLRPVDVRDRARPMPLADLPVPGGALDVAARAGQVVVAGGAGLHLVDAADPRRPHIAAAYPMDAPAEQIALMGTRALVLAGGTVREIDLAAPAAPTLVGSWGEPWSATAVAASAAAILVGASDGARLVDARSDAPRVTGPLVVPGGDVALADRLAVVVSGAGAALYSVEGGTLGLLSEVPVYRPTLVAAVGGRAAVAHVYEEGIGRYVDAFFDIAILDIRDPRRPRHLGSLGITDWSVLDSQPALAVDGTRLVLGRGNVLEWWDAPASGGPRRVAALAMPAPIRGIAMHGDVVYAAMDQRGLGIVDATDPLAPVVLGSIDTPGEALAVAVVGTRAYVAANRAGLRILDVSDPRRPAEVTAFAIADRAVDVAAAGGRIAVAAGMGGLYVCEDPDMPRGW